MKFMQTIMSIVLPSYEFSGMFGIDDGLITSLPRMNRIWVALVVKNIILILELKNEGQC